jgi:hypothetical protein
MNFIINNISYSQLLIIVIVVSFIFGIIHSIKKQNYKNKQNSLQKSGSHPTHEQHNSNAELEKILLNSGISTQNEPYISNTEQYQGYFIINFIFPQDIGNIYSLSLNIDDANDQRSLNTAAVMSRMEKGGVPIFDYEQGDFTIGIYTVEINHEVFNFLMMQALKKHYRFDVPTHYDIFFKDGSHWSLEQNENNVKDLGYKIHRELFPIDDDYFMKLETSRIEKFTITQENRYATYFLRQEDCIRIKRMVTMHRIAQQTYFIEKNPII